MCDSGVSVILDCLNRRYSRMHLVQKYGENVISSCNGPSFWILKKYVRYNSCLGLVLNKQLVIVYRHTDVNQL